MKKLFLFSLLLFLSVSIEAQLTSVAASRFIKRTNETAAGTCNAIRTGWVYYDIALGTQRWCDGVAWADFGGSSGGSIEVGVTPSDGTANTALKTNATGEVADMTGVTQPSGKTLFVTSQAATDEPLTIKGAAAQSGNYLDILTSADANVFKIESNGRVTVTERIIGGSGGLLAFGDSNFGDVLGLGQTVIGYASGTGIIFRDNIGNRMWVVGGAAVASAAAIVPTGTLFHVTGTTNITSVTATIAGFNMIPGQEITIIFDDVLTFTDGSNLKLAGNFVTTADDTITLKFDGTNWYEICRSVN